MVVKFQAHIFRKFFKMLLVLKMRRDIIAIKKVEKKQPQNTAKVKIQQMHKIKSVIEIVYQFIEKRRKINSVNYTTRSYTRDKSREVTLTHSTEIQAILIPFIQTLAKPKLVAISRKRQLNLKTQISTQILNEKKKSNIWA